MSAYIQTYYNGLHAGHFDFGPFVDWLVFLDPDWRDGISVSADLGENGQALA